VSSAQVTSRIETLARDRLKGLSGRARRFVATASILGGSFRLEDVGEMLGESPGALLAALDEGAVRVPSRGQGGQPGLPA
jgi:hypothetical protein